jgi:hypothetical protein
METQQINDSQLQQLEAELKTRIENYLDVKSPNRTYDITDSLAFYLFDDGWQRVDNRYAMKEDLLKLVQIAANAESILPGTDAIGLGRNARKIHTFYGLLSGRT